MSWKHSVAMSSVVGFFSLPMIASPSLSCKIPTLGWTIQFNDDRSRAIARDTFNETIDKHNGL